MERESYLLESAHDGITLVDKFGKVSFVAKSVEKITGYTREELIGADPSSFVHPDDLPELVSVVASIKDDFGKRAETVYRARHKEGHWMMIKATITNLFHVPEVDAIVFNYEDITEQHNTRQRMEFDRRNLDALINSTNDLMWSVDNNLRLITANKAYVSTIEFFSGIRLQPGDIVSELPGFSEEISRSWKEKYQRVLSGEVFKIEEYTTEPYEAWGEISFNPIWEDGQVIGAACFSRDISDRVRIARKIERNESVMASAERLAHIGGWEYTFGSAAREGI